MGQNVKLVSMLLSSDELVVIGEALLQYTTHLLTLPRGEERAARERIVAGLTIRLLTQTQHQSEMTFTELPNDEGGV